MDGKELTDTISTVQIDETRSRTHLPSSIPITSIQVPKLVTPSDVLKYVPEKEAESWTTIQLRRVKCKPILFKGILFIFLPLWIWLSMFVIVGKEDLPGGSIFVLVILACGGRLLGYAAAFIGLPPMLGMLGLGLAVRNVPYIDFGRQLDPVWSSPLRQTALVVILTRAGLGLDLRILMELKSIIIRFAIFPTTIEAITVALISHYLLDFPWSWGFLLGFVLAPVSPAVVVPRLLELREKGHGVEKGIPTFIIAAACLDNVLAISLFGVTLNFVFPSGNLTLSIIQGPLQVLIGIVYGLASGLVLGILFDKTEENSVTFVRFILTLGSGIISILGFSKLGYSGAGALGCLLSSFIASCTWKVRNVFPGVDPLYWGFYMLWYIFEPLLFGVIGCQINIMSLDLNVVYKGIAIILISLCVRLIVSFLMVTHANFTMKEKLFSAIAWIAKATVQAAIGPIALDMVKTRGNDPEERILGDTVLTLAVLSILLTAAVGELGVIISGPRFLSQVQPQTEVSEAQQD